MTIDRLEKKIRVSCPREAGNFWLFFWLIRAPPAMSIDDKSTCDTSSTFTAHPCAAANLVLAKTCSRPGRAGRHYALRLSHERGSRHSGTHLSEIRTVVLLSIQHRTRNTLRVTRSQSLGRGNPLGAWTSSAECSCHVMNVSADSSMHGRHNSRRKGLEARD